MMQLFFETEKNDVPCSICILSAMHILFSSHSSNLFLFFPIYVYLNISHNEQYTIVLNV